MALGAASRRIITGVSARAFTQIGIGGVAGALPGPAIATIGVEDAHGTGLTGGMLATAGVGLFVILVALVACAMPLRRALRIEPIQALRSDGWEVSCASLLQRSVSSRSPRSVRRRRRSSRPV